MDLLPNQYTPADYGLLAASSIGLLGDWGQTRHIARSGHPETNRILGTHPKLSDVDKYFAASLLANYLIGNNLPPKYRRMLWTGVAGTQASMMLNNNNVGLKMDWKF